MLQILQKTPEFDFMGKKQVAAVVSAILILIAIGSLIMQGLKLGIDFTGGTLVEVGYQEPVQLDSVRTALNNAGYEDAVVQHFGTTRDVLIRLAPQDRASQAELSNQLYEVLRRSSGGSLDLRRIEFVGPQVGEELTEQGGLAVLIALGAILIYVGLRFEYRFALGAVAALAHDVILTLGVFSVLSLEFDLTVLAAVLAVIGYSLNDTIVVFDRVRENFRKIRRGSSTDVINISLNQTLSRTLMTSLTTLLVLLSLFFVGGELIHGFATALIIGVVIGTYSSMYIASTTALVMGISKADLMPVAKEGADDLESMP